MEQTTAGRTRIHGLRSEFGGARAADPAALKANILVVDDHPENLLAVEAILTELDQNLITAQSGEEALKILLDRDVILVLLDVRMPGLDGFETAKLIRAREKTRHIPIIFITAMNTLEDDVDRGYSLGAVDYLLKPFAPENLRSKVSVFVELYRKSEQVRDRDAILHQMELRAVEQREQEKRLAESKLYAEKLERQARDLARSNEDLEQFAYIASHDLQEPLRKITNYVQLLQRRFKDKADGTESKYIESIYDGAARMQEQIHSLLDYSRVGRADVVREPVDLEAVLAKIISDHERVIQKTRAVVTHDPMPTVPGNPAHLAMLLQNLIQNAIKFHGKASPKIHVAAEENDAGWIVSVKDNGIGIESKYFERIFVIFQRLHTRSEYPGTGMGLAFCKKIVERHSGRIWLESEPGTGSTFYFSLPK